MKHLAAIAFALAPLTLHAQQLPPLETLLNRLYAYSSEYAATLPSLSCDESIVSQHAISGKKGRLELRVKGTMREFRKNPPDLNDPFLEEHSFTTVNGKPINGKNGPRIFEMPYFVQGGFANLIGFHGKEMEDCFNYSVTPLNNGMFQLDYDRKDDPVDPKCSTIFPGTRRSIIAETESGHILHSERWITPQAADQNDEAYYGAIDYAPQQFGDRTFWLPARFSSHDAVDEGRMTATYSNCHRFGSEVRILPGVTEAAPRQNLNETKSFQ